ncbi:aromatic-amino-acid transaminase [Candidatus Kinetoplastibacterium blastocrithidii TCC012E]|nr:aromatic amino acid transaminase [Candidatus Kinetoplastibacterium blastocrithidii]AFZ83560.1 aromatic amino acid aminotransferase [Candidatus Kinetoplastibacterium blastocrithidii (ex Strigomonas culicis)]AGF49679.1 aromatic-amino-acid transaminase [Candidatus Kinetoplastibacterium blastocrithidii TCC012E]
MKDIFKSVKLAPSDPILGLNEKFNSDNRLNKVNLGVGVYYDKDGRIPLMEAVCKSEAFLASKKLPRGYLPIDGISNYNKNAMKLLFGENSNKIEEGRALTVQTLGGTGALKIGADFLYQLLPNSKVLISNPSWENHRAIFEKSGFLVDTYPYYDPANNNIAFDRMLESLNTTASGTIVVLHACCHNPTGIDPTVKQWREIVETIKERNLIPFLDIAYQGFGDGLSEDAYVVRMFSDMDIPSFISSSFSKSFALYGERVGALTITTNNRDETNRALSQIKRLIRSNYSNPPTHGASIVNHVLSSDDLFEIWENELSDMRNRIKLMRKNLINKIGKHSSKKDFSFVLDQRGMFSYSGLTSHQVDILREQYGIYAVSSGRICVAALNDNNIDLVASSISQVLDK